MDVCVGGTAVLVGKCGKQEEPDTRVAVIARGVVEKECNTNVVEESHLLHSHITLFLSLELSFKQHTENLKVMHVPSKHISTQPKRHGQGKEYLSLECIGLISTNNLTGMGLTLLDMLEHQRLRLLRS